MSQCNYVTMLQYHYIAMSLCHDVTMVLCHYVIMSPCHYVIDMAKYRVHYNIEYNTCSCKGQPSSCVRSDHIGNLQEALKDETLMKIHLYVKNSFVKFFLNM